MSVAVGWSYPTFPGWICWMCIETLESEMFQEKSIGLLCPVMCIHDFFFKNKNMWFSSFWSISGTSLGLLWVWYEITIKHHSSLCIGIKSAYCTYRAKRSHCHGCSDFSASLLSPNDDTFGQELLPFWDKHVWY